MNSFRSPCKELIAEKARSLGIEKTGVAAVMLVSSGAVEMYDRWIASGRHGEMAYLERYGEVRANPSLLLPSARSIICCAVNYFPSRKQCPDAPQIASYALGCDYHDVVREKLEALAAFIRENFGGETRVCVDTAPVRERYWAVQSGLGFVGKNNQLIIPGKGSYFFLGEIIATHEIEPDEPCRLSCGDCGACLRVCPSGALMPDGGIDARRCLSYLTIEYRGDLPPGVPLGNRLYGCDSCQAACPHNRHASATNVEEFAPSERLLNLSCEAIENMSQQEFSALFRHSAIKRTKLSGLQRNAMYIRRAQKGSLPEDAPHDARSRLR